MLDLAEIIPHRPPMVLIDALVECSRGSAVAMRVFSPDSCGVRDGQVVQGALIESLAQTAAALFGHHAKAEGRGVAGGMLVGVSEFRFGRPVRCGDRLTLTVNITRNLPPFCLVAGQVSTEGTVVAEGVLKFYVPGEVPAV